MLMRTHPGMCFSMCRAENTCLDLLFIFIDASQTACKVKCLLFVEIDEFDVPDTSNMHCAKLPDAQDDRISDFAKAEIFYRTFGLVKSNISPDRIKICRTEKFKWNFDK